MSAAAPQTPREVMRSLPGFIALSGGLGLAPRAPGTFGSLGGFALFFALQPLPLVARVVAYLILVVVASWACARTGEALGEHDHGALVIDETVAMSLVLEVAPWSVAGFGLAFALFRLFDIWKPWPVNLADESGKGGFFVVLDDLLAAVWAMGMLMLARYAGLV